MQKIILLLALLFISLQINAQYKNDNVLYKTIYPEDVKKELENNPGYILLDVRSKGEHEDTSATGLNIGHLKNAINIDVRELQGRLNELKDYKNSPVFVYCSHSQRSRRASKVLADSGFTKVFNINGGMTTFLNDEYEMNALFNTQNKFTYLSPLQFCKKINDSGVIVVDVRTDDLYNSMTGDEKDNAIGKLKNAIHIPFHILKNDLSVLSKTKQVIIIDDYGNKSAEAAKFLTDKGYTNVYVLFEGIYNLITKNVECKKSLWQKSTSYDVINSDDFYKMEQENINFLLLDVRPYAEYKNQAKEVWRNIGRIKNAVNIYTKDVAREIHQLASFKNKPVVIYNFISDVDAFEAAATLTLNGFSNVSVLAGGIFTLRWTAANIKGKSDLKKLVDDIPSYNW